MIPGNCTLSLTLTSRDHPRHAGRRRVLDAVIVSLHPPFVQVFADYNSVLKQKSSLLQAARENGDSLDKVTDRLQPWNEQLVSLATRIHRGRVRFVERINEVLEKKLFGREELSIRYVSALEGKGDLSDFTALITERLAARVQAEIVAGHPLIGTHRDDLEIKFDGHDIRKFGSAGQQRSALLLLQLPTSTSTMPHVANILFQPDDIDESTIATGKLSICSTTNPDIRHYVHESFVENSKRRSLLLENGKATPI
jgi:DNA replication and repair protein RecF